MTSRYESSPRARAGGSRRLAAGGLTVWALITLAALCSCGRSGSGLPAAATDSRPGTEAAEIIERYRALDSARDSRVELAAHVTEPDGPSQEVRLVMYKKRQPDGGQIILVDFTAPAVERDRDALITISPRGETEAIRWAQSTGSFITSRSSIDEESLFGLTVQELVGGQPEKYDYRLAGEQTLGPTPVYKLEGTLKQSAESRFTRVIMLISKENYTSPVVEVYDNHGTLARRVIVNRVEQIGGYWTRISWEIDNRENGKKIDFEASDVKYNQSLPDSIFTREYLKKIASR